MPARPHADWLAFMTEHEDFDPDLWFLVERDGELVACGLHWRTFQQRGWVKDIVVRESERGKGLGEGAAAARLPRLRRARRDARWLEGRLDESDRRAAALRAHGFVTDQRYGIWIKRAVTTTSTTVSLLRWLRRQMREPTADRERLEAAIANDDPLEARRLVARMPFNDAQRRHVEQLLDEWERTSTANP